MAGDYRTRSDPKPFRPKPRETKEADMKRTRHIEITRYSRRVTVIQGSDDTAVPAAELSAIEVVANDWEVVPLGHEEVSDGHLRVVESAAVQMSRPRPSFSLRDWLRRRF
jgi:hypothetical protein